MAQHTTDAVIIGGGPAGLAAALALRSKGLEVVVIDQRVGPIDKACGEGLMPDAIECLAELGVLIPTDVSAPFTGIRFLDETNEVESEFRSGTGLGISRVQLHKLLIKRAERAGVQLLFGRKPRVLGSENVEVGDQNIRTRWLVGADGQSSPMRNMFELAQHKKLQTRYGIRRHYAMKPWTDHVEVHWSNIGQMYITPVHDSLVSFAFVSRDAKTTMDEAFASLPALAERVRDHRQHGTDRGAITTTRRLKNIVRGNVALIGDASGSVDAVTGEGMAMSFRQALALANAIEQDDLRSYETTHEDILRLPTLMASTLLLLDKYPALRRRALAALSSSPETFSKMLAVHLGSEKFWQVAIQHGPKLGWNLVRSV